MMANASNHRLLVKRFHGNKHYLSALSPRDLSPQAWSENHENLNLFFFHEECEISISSCGGLLYFDDGNDQLVICNPTTQELKFLPPSNVERPSGISLTLFEGSCFGYDSQSDDYKVLRHLAHIDDYEDEDEEGMKCYGSTTDQLELYSLKDNSWKEIPFPDVGMRDGGSIYLNGSYYWQACMETSSDFFYGIVWFDFATESFSSSSLPVPMVDLDYITDLVEFDGSLGVTGYQRSGHSKSFQLWVLKQGSWAKVFDVVLCDVRRIVGLEDDRLLFLEGKTSSDGLCRLLVYDWIAKELKGLDVYDYRGEMMVVSYVESRVPLPNAKPMNDYDEAFWRSRVDGERRRVTRRTTWPDGARTDSETERPDFDHGNHGDHDDFHRIPFWEDDDIVWEHWTRADLCDDDDDDELMEDSPSGEDEADDED